MNRSLPNRIVALVVAAGLLWWPGAHAAEDEPAALREMTLLDRQDLEANLRWILARERSARGAEASGKKPVKARVGVFADAGCWHVGAISVVDALEKAGIACRAIDRSMMTADGLSGLDAIVFPGGWAPFQFAELTPAGGATVRAFAEKGGRVLGICAGGYLLSKLVIWEGKEFPYPIALFDGTAQGPIAGFLPWPGKSPARLNVTKAGVARGLESVATHDVLYYGGATFVGGSETTVLATYADGSPSIIVRSVGKGEVVLSGAHLERPAPADGGDESGPPALSGAWIKGLLGLK